jgi:hypothetical protein
MAHRQHSWAASRSGSRPRRPRPELAPRRRRHRRAGQPAHLTATSPQSFVQSPDWRAGPRRLLSVQVYPSAPTRRSRPCLDGDDPTVLTMIVNSSLAGAGRPAGFHPEGRYEFKIHLDGAAAGRARLSTSWRRPAGGTKTGVPSPRYFLFRAGAEDRSPCCPGTIQQRDRRPARSLAAHRGFAPVPFVPQAGHLCSRPDWRSSNSPSQDMNQVYWSACETCWPKWLANAQTRGSVESSPFR